MEITEEPTNSASQMRDSRAMDSSYTAGPPPPPLPPPPLPPSPFLCPPTVSNLTSGLNTDTDDSTQSSSLSGERRQLNVNAWKDEIATGIQKLWTWGMCNHEDDTTWVACNRHTAPILQQGPECGIVALCMALNMVELQTSVSADKGQILKTAREKGYTIQGEIFSAKNMLELAACVCGVRGEAVVGNMVDNREAIIKHLANGWPVLVPYDKDGNCEPCCRRGHHAHWAVITGFLLQCKRRHLPDLNSTSLQQDSAITNLYYIGDCAECGLSESTVQTVRTILEGVPAADTYVLARQGKTQRICPWSYAALSDSNLDLLELGSTIEDDISMFVIPEGGIQAGLRGQFVLIRP